MIEEKGAPTPEGAMIEAKAPEDRAQMRRAIVYSVLGGLCPLIPVPFVDDVVLTHLNRRYVRGIFRDGSRGISDAQLKALVDGPSKGALGCLVNFVLYPIKKIFKKIFFFLSIKDCVDVASRLFHQGVLLRQAIEGGHLGAGAGAVSDEALERVREAMGATMEEVDTRPINQLLGRLFTGGRLWTRRAARMVWGRVREARRSSEASSGEALDVSDVAESAELSKAVEAFERAVWTESDYLEALARHFERKIAGGARPDQESSAGDPVEP